MFKHKWLKSIKLDTRSGIFQRFNQAVLKDLSKSESNTHPLLQQDMDLDWKKRNAFGS